MRSINQISMNDATNQLDDTEEVTDNDTQQAVSATTPIVDEADYIEINEAGEFTCVECENEVKPQVNGEEGAIDADLVSVKKDLASNKTKLVVSFCPICGMEYKFELVDEPKAAGEPADTRLVLVPSDEEK